MIRALGAAALALLFALPHPLPASDRTLQPQGEPRPAQVPRDDEFGVGTRQLGLQRRVEMYQWRGGARGYERVWSSRPIQAGAAGSGHENPGELPLPTRNWRPAILLDGHRVDEEVVERMGRWRVMRPSFTALPVSLAATFQPEGDGLGSAANPLAPEIGDLRITWRELVLPDLAGRIELRGDAWRLASSSDAGGGGQGIQESSSETVPGLPAREPRNIQWFAIAALLVLGLAVLLAVRRRR
jgi:MYXO-CTERM domain-containing protein